MIEAIVSIEIRKSTKANAIDVLVDGKRWGWFDRYSHGPQGNSFVLHQQGGYIVHDEGGRQGLKVYGDRLTERLTIDRPWHRPEISIEERLRIAAQYAAVKGLLRDPIDIDAEVNAKREAVEREHRARRAKQREHDMAIGMDIADKCYPQLDDGYREHLEKLRLASSIADALERERGE
jgi:hypothetical protein